MKRHAFAEARSEITRAARVVYRERLQRAAPSPEKATRAFEHALRAVVGDPSPQSIGRYLAASERVATMARLAKAGTVSSPGRAAVADTLGDAAQVLR